MKHCIVVVVAILVVGGGTYWWTQTPPSALPVPENINPPVVTETEQETTPVGTKDYKSPWFKVTYPANFSSESKEKDEATFTSPDGLVEFYVYSPQWSGEPVSYLQPLPTERLEEDTTTPSVTPFTNEYGTSYDKKITRYVTYVAKDGSYKRSFASITAGWVSTPESTELTSKTNLVFGIKYKDQAAYDTYLESYLAFKKSLVLFAD
jgi:hypothetical protein